MKKTKKICLDSGWITTDPSNGIFSMSGLGKIGNMVRSVRSLRFQDGASDQHRYSKLYNDVEVRELYIFQKRDEEDTIKQMLPDQDIGYIWDIYAFRRKRQRMLIVLATNRSIPQARRALVVSDDEDFAFEMVMALS